MNKFYFLIIITIIPLMAVNFSGSPDGWFEQSLPIDNIVQDICFVDSLTGWAVAYEQITGPDSSYILKTTDGGYNWAIQNKSGGIVSAIQFTDNNIGYAAFSGGGTGFLLKTTNSGMNWSPMNVGGVSLTDLFFTDSQTGWVCDHLSGGGTVWKTTNGGGSWTTQNMGNSPSNLHFNDVMTGWFNSTDGEIYKTTNGGSNWNMQIDLAQNIRDIGFADGNTGWVLGPANMYKTTNGGINWFSQSLPNDSTVSKVLSEFSIVNNDKVWLVGGIKQYNLTAFRGVVYYTTNGGADWNMQIPDTSYGIGSYAQVFTMGDSMVWAYDREKGVHTSTDGINTGVELSSNVIPSAFSLRQNYPNPFNPSTRIKFDIPRGALVKLKIYDMLGREVAQLVNEKLSAGTYEYEWNGIALPSGVYFYKLITDSFTETKRMVLVK